MYQNVQIKSQTYTKNFNMASVIVIPQTCPHVDSYSNSLLFSVELYRCCTKTLLADDQWWPRTSGGRLRFARAITYLLHHRFGSFLKGNKRKPYKKDWQNCQSCRQIVSNFPKLPTCQHRGIFGGLQQIRHL